MEIKKIIVCGDSFCSASRLERNHFSQILEDRYGYQVTNFAQGGMSNVGICFQLREAIVLKPDVIVYNTTSPDRVELVLKDTFNINKGLRNFVYLFPFSTSYGLPYVGNEQSSIFSTVWQGLENQTRISISKDQLTALKSYLKYFFNWKLKETTDSWMFGYWHQQILDNGIRPILVSRGEKISQPMYDFADQNLSWPTCYHTDTATQEIVASNIAAKIENW